MLKNLPFGSSEIKSLVLMFKEKIKWLEKGVWQ